MKFSRFIILVGMGFPTVICANTVADILNTKIPQKNNEIVKTKPLYQQLKLFIESGGLENRREGISYRKSSYERDMDSKTDVINNFYYPCVFQCDGRNLSSSSSINMFLGMHSIYYLLRENYGLSSQVSCTAYSPSPRDPNLSIAQSVRLSINEPYSDRMFSNFYEKYPGSTMQENIKLGDLSGGNQRIPWRIGSDLGNLPRDIYRDIQAITYLNYNIDDDSKNEFIKSFQQRRRFIERSCGKRFMLSYDKFLNDLGGIWKEHINNVDAKFLAEQQYLAEQKIAKDEAKRQEELAKNEAIRKEGVERKNAAAIQQACLNSKSYHLYKLSNKIANHNDMLTNANQALETDKQAERISGVIDMSARHNAAKTILYAKKQRDKFFSEYKKLGGIATTALGVKETSNPCQ